MNQTSRITVFFVGVILSGLTACSSGKMRNSPPPKAIEPTQVASGRIWKDADSGFDPASCPGKIMPSAYRLLTVDTVVANKKLVFQGKEPGLIAIDSVEVEIPMPDGSWEKYKISQVQVMAPELAAKFPYLKTYAGYSLQFPADQIRLEVNPEGIRVLILSTRGSILIDPVCKDDKIHMISFFKKDMPEGSKEDFERK